jgi:hypothetical protein
MLGAEVAFLVCKTEMLSKWGQISGGGLIFCAQLSSGFVDCFHFLRLQDAGSRVLRGLGPVAARV